MTPSDQADTIPFSGGHAQFFKMSSTFFARVEVGGVSPVWVCVYMCLCVCLCVYLSCFCLCVVFVCVCVLKSLIHTCACGGPSVDSMWRQRGRRERSECATVEVVSDC